ncbi:MAG TPA: DUF1501 domain-containing protein [Gemmataceae bacterium]|jgi:hypothetical protein|nr:DUF1501 domain-containing protein [Gemmataceae bacterium]
MNPFATNHIEFHIPVSHSRRDFLYRAGGGLGGIALSWMLARDGLAGESSASNKSLPNPLAAKKPHFEGKAKSVIFMFMVGGPSQMDLFDPKPDLLKNQGKPLPESFGKPISQFTKGDTPLLGSTRKFKKHGKSGVEISDLMPHLATCVDDIALLRSCWCTNTVHAPAMYELHSGRTIMGWPSLGSWVTYGLGSVNENLPAYCVMVQPEGTPEGGAPCWGSAFLPAVYQGTLFRKGASPILNLKPPEGVTQDRQRRTLDLLRKMNEAKLDPDDSELSARIASYELAFRMQQHAPEAVDLTKETAATKRAYGFEDKRTNDFGTRCLLARRLVERGVRFVQLYSGGGPVSIQWDAHDDINGNHEKMCGLVDQPIAALLKDLKERGLLDTTLVVWASEFGRTPNSQGGKGRDHNPLGYTMWMAGGGVKGGQAIGETDEFGLRATKDRISVNDFHATILHLLGLDHEKLTFLHNARDERLTDVAGKVVEQVLA